MDILATVLVSRTTAFIIIEVMSNAYLEPTHEMLECNQFKQKPYHTTRNDTTPHPLYQSLFPSRASRDPFSDRNLLLARVLASSTTTIESRGCLPPMFRLYACTSTISGSSRVNSDDSLPTSNRRPVARCTATGSSNGNRFVGCFRMPLGGSAVLLAACVGMDALGDDDVCSR